MSKLIPIACLALLGTAGHASAESGQNLPPATESATADKIQQVNVNGTRADDTETRRLSTAARMVFGREELDRNGDTSISEVLKRLPGVTLGGPPGRGGGGVRMRGLGNGYTQMLVNGERPPPGFSLEALAPDQVERIEVMRGPVAEHSTQAIAGTINIVLREGYRQKDVQLRVADSIEEGRHGVNVGVVVPGQQGALTWNLTGAVNQARQHNDSDTVNLDTLHDGTVQREQRIHDEGGGVNDSLFLTPRFAYKFTNGDTLTFQPFLIANRNRSGGDSLLDQPIGTVAPEYAHQRSDSTSRATFLRGFGNWLHRMDGGARLEVKFGFAGGRSSSDVVRNTYDAAAAPLKRYVDADSTRDGSLNTGGKYTRPMGKGHLFAAGWEIEGGHRSQEHVAAGDSAALFDDGGASLTADSRRIAAFAQDEWDVTPQFSTYLGLRWEGIRITSDQTAAGRGEIRNLSKVWSPVLHGVWRIPEHDKDQVRASVTRSYKAPALNDLIAVPTISTYNDATRPDRTGNPHLKPELATGIDVAYEHYVGRSGILSASAFARNIDDLQRRTTMLAQTASGPRWVSTPINIGKARTAGLELEAKFPLTDVYPSAPNVDVRSNYSRYWSSVDGIPGPNNRLDQQPKQTANVGADWRLKGVPLTVGGGLNWTPATLVQTTANETAYTGMKRQFDVYGLVKLNAGAQLRLSANNVDPRVYDSARSVDTGTLVQSAATATRTYTTIGIRYEMKM
ncbi:TonB-dependent receptor plug domain-containing protein [Telluria antibiotica]|uniref:TonB-dependent receptor plug domain-containing protein n=1 Tax=Telluria antibiotica TaxID=2717319 RepID=UPI001E45C76C|nr:TonB-dependent receptor [Telluria antibiotica]